MNRNSSNDSVIAIGARNLNANGIRNSPVTGLLSHRRVMSLTSTTTETAEDFSSSNNNNADFISRNRRSLSVASSDESDLQVKLGRLTAGSTKVAKNVFDDLLSSNEDGKHDYDWLLAPPGTSLIPSSDKKESQLTSVSPKRNPLVRSGSTDKTSRLSVSQSDSNQTSRPARSSSATRTTRASISTTQHTNHNKNLNILNTSSASVSSYVRPSTPTNRSSPSSKPSVVSSRAPTSRPSTPSRNRPLSTITRPSTPTNRPQPVKTTSTVRPSSRPSTPTHRSPTISHNGRSTGPTSRPSSPGPRIRPSPQPFIPPDFPHETPPNLRTTLPARPLSAGRSRPGPAMTVNGHIEIINTGSITRRQPSPIVTRGRIAEPSGKGWLHVNGHSVETLDSRRTLRVPESITRKPNKTLNSESGTTGFGRSISKKSLDMAIKHMDIRNGGVRPLSGSKIYPQSIRSGNPGIQPSCASNTAGSINSSYSNYVNSKSGNLNNTKNGNLKYGYSENKVKPVSVERKSPFSAQRTEMDIYESSRYDAILMKEDLKNTSWLHSADEISDQGPLFDNGFESLPEPFSPL
ncbi:uncharacterized protein [Rutidosis leptorrhynchoides]|uniref:uncharacterized protein n=1 Tax=Rutidosis leptorrhynchoides TaxID=125765 RepID=UPI003A9A28EE